MDFIKKDEVYFFFEKTWQSSEKMRSFCERCSQKDPWNQKCVSHEWFQGDTVMSGKIAQTRKILKAAIKEICSTSWMFVRNPEKDFTRNRKISFRDILLFFLCKEGGNLTTELFRYFRLAPDSASISAFIQQRDKILPEAFITLFHLFTRKACPQKLYRSEEHTSEL